MKKSIILFLGAVGFILSFVSCSKPEEKLPLFDFGSGVYDEPFVGLLKSKPALLVKSMQYPPFSWVVSDTVCLEKNLEISFNEECVRSKSEAIIQFRDSLYSSINGIRIFCNGEIAPNGEIKIIADSLVKTLSLKYMISPLMSDTVIQGCIFIQGKELDVVNGEMLQQDNNIIANWECKQEIGWPILLWLLWLVTVVLIIIIAYYICLGLRWIFALMGNSLPLSNKGLNQYSRIKSDKQKKKDSEKELPEELEEVLKQLEKERNFKRYNDYNIVRRVNGNINIKHRYFPETEIEIKGKVAFAKAGCIGVKGGPQNQFLNYLMPSFKYVVDDCFTYKTDRLCRVCEASADRNKAMLLLKRGGRDSDTQRNIVEKLDGYKSYDDGGHIFSNEKNGANELINQVPMNSKINRRGEEGKWRDIELKENEVLEEGRKLVSKRQIQYKGSSKRPYIIKVINFVDGKKEKKLCVDIENPIPGIKL